MTELKTFDDLYHYAKNNGYEETAKILRDWVEGGQKDDFMPNFTSRAMCRCAGMGIDGTDPDLYKITSYLDTTRGSDLYWYMWQSE